ncbi:MAG: prolyl oligopeptidase family serine peptidase [Wenzhouxiangella sp.]
MNQTIRFGLFFLVLTAFGSAVASAVPTRAFFDNAEVRNMLIAPDGRHVAFTFEAETEVRLAVMRLADSAITATFGFGNRQHVLDFFWSGDERLVMTVNEVTGFLDTMFLTPPRLYAANADGSNRRQVFDDQNLFGFRILHTLPNDPDHILIERFHFGDDGEPRAHRVNITRGGSRYLGDSPPTRDVIRLGADNAGEIRFSVEFIDARNFEDMEFNLFLKHGEEWRRLEIETERRRPNISPLGFSADNQRVYFRSNHDIAENDRQGVFRYDFATEELELLFRHPDVDVAGPLIGHDGEILGVFSLFGPRTYTFFDDKLESHRDARLLAQLMRSFPDDDVSLTSFTRGGRYAILFVRGDRNPGDFYLFDTENLEAQFLASTRPELPREALSPMRAVRLPARDGVELHGMLTMPQDSEGPLPLIVNVHGGPFGITDHWGFNPAAQFYAHHGFATLQVNFRGSGNRGDDFVRKGWRQWGQAMQDDVTDATRWAIEQGIADPDRICIMGASYGGYATLMGMIREPELYRCGIGFIGVYDLVWFREGDGSDFARGRDRRTRMNFERFMFSHVAESSDGLEEWSPVHQVQRLQGEVFIIHGARAMCASRSGMRSA